MGYLSNSVLLYSILSIAIVANYILLEYAPIMLAFCSLLLPSYYSNNFAGKTSASLALDKQLWECNVKKLKNKVVLNLKQRFMCCYMALSNVL